MTLLPLWPQFTFIVPHIHRCPKDGYYHYNAAIVYDESGTIVAKYYKSHAWATNEDQPAIPDRVTWKASFGVTFGMFICFDIAFDDPAVVLAKQGVKHFIYPVVYSFLCSFVRHSSCSFL
jgi:pantetheine hydrolase